MPTEADHSATEAAAAVADSEPLSKKQKKEKKKEKKQQKEETKEAAASPSSVLPDSSALPSSSVEATAEPSSTHPAAASPPPSDPDLIRLWDESSPRRERMKMHYVTTRKQVRTALAVIAREATISVDCEGVALGRTGPVCLVQVSTPVDAETNVFHVFLFDVVALGRAALDTGLGAILSAPTPIKLFFDVRRDSEALYHQFGVELKGVCDMQLLELAARRACNQVGTYLPGLGRLLGERFPDLDPALQVIKEGMSGNYEATPNLWELRPLTREQNIYAAVDVALLHVLLQQITTPPTRKARGAAASITTAAGVTAEPAASEAAATASPEPSPVAAEPASPAAAAASEKSGEAATSKPTSEAAAAAAKSKPRPMRHMYVNEQTRKYVEQYSDIVWAASTRYETHCTHGHLRDSVSFSSLSGHVLARCVCAAIWTVSPTSGPAATCRWTSTTRRFPCRWPPRAPRSWRTRPPRRKQRWRRRAAARASASVANRPQRRRPRSQHPSVLRLWLLVRLSLQASRLLLLRLLLPLRRRPCRRSCSAWRALLRRATTTRASPTRSS